MRELILAMSMSLDGFVSGPAGETEWIFSGDQEAIAWKLENAWNASLHIMGSRTFQGMASFWPTSTNLFAPPMNQIPKAVFSKQGTAILPAKADSKASAGLPPGAGSWSDAYVASGDLAEEIFRLKAGEGKPIIAHGGATFARSLIAEDLVDRYMLMVYPLALGQGLPIFSDLALPRRLELISSQTFPKGSIAQIYRRGERGTLAVRNTYSAASGATPALISSRIKCKWLSPDAAEVRDTAISPVEGNFEALSAAPCAIDEKAAPAINAAHVPETTVADPPFSFPAGDWPAMVEISSDIDVDGDCVRRGRNGKRCCKQAEDKSECRGSIIAHVFSYGTPVCSTRQHCRETGKPAVTCAGALRWH